MSTQSSSAPIMYRLQPPEELVFKGPFNDYVSQKLKIENTGDSPMGFKVKTTTPKKFSVKPNMGCIEPHGSQDIHICLHSFTYDPNDKTRHKFMVQVVSLTAATDTATVESMIKDYERNNPTKLKESKLKVATVPSQSEVERPSTNSVVANGNVYPPPSSMQSASGLGASGGPLSNLANQQLPSLEDFRQLEADISNLRSENSQLKEENAYQRKQISDLERSGGKGGGDISAGGGLSGSQKSMAGSVQRMIFLIAVLFAGMMMGQYMANTKSQQSRH